LGAIFVKSKHTQQFFEGFHIFCPNFHRFCPDFKEICPDFHQIKRFGCAVAPPFPTPVVPSAPFVSFLSVFVRTVINFKMEQNRVNNNFELITKERLRRE